jgi:hypothetical protein
MPAYWVVQGPAGARLEGTRWSPRRCAESAGPGQRVTAPVQHAGVVRFEPDDDGPPELPHRGDLTRYFVRVSTRSDTTERPLRACTGRLLSFTMSRNAAICFAES